jgi:hypothetical protein
MIVAMTSDMDATSVTKDQGYGENDDKKSLGMITLRIASFRLPTHNPVSGSPLQPNECI